ncbi:amino acid ABC transporter permease [Naumannella sp. ID2617S]|nr:amino acid ABC transporter permease [Naumannella sp. ID2617S]
MDFLQKVLSFLPQLIGAAPVVIQLSLGAMALALVLGLLIALARISRFRVLQVIALIYVEILRGTPLLVQLVYIFFVLPAVGIDIQPLPAGILGLGLNYAAYLSEVFRSSILSVERGQTEAALSLGYTPTKALWRVVLPQSMVVSLGPIGNYFIAMVKDTALTSVIAVTEILKQANIINSETFETTAVYTAAALLYLAISLPLSRIVHGIERTARSRG